ncbi:MAG: hypothetical protein IT162_02530 [Bryobacterales bacterium]|nr:hypothetical protein [Bryobacterales bacterium]
MSSKSKALEARLEELAALRGVGAAAAEAPLRNALADRSGLYVAKAAAVAADLGLRALTPELAAAYARFFDNPVKTDPQCWAKRALAKSLHALGHRETEPFLRGLRHVQLEPVYGGEADSAGALRGQCALALIDTNLNVRQVLTALTDLLVDPDQTARLDAVRAVGGLGQPESALLLRLKTLTGDASPDVMRECLISLMALAPADSAAFVARHLQTEDELRCVDAAEALVTSREPDALAAVLAFLRGRRLLVDLRRSLLLTLAASPLPESGEYLVALVEGEVVDIAEAAVTALGASRFRELHRQRLGVLVAERGSAVLRAAYAKAFNPQ